MSTLVVSLHDVAPSTLSESREWLEKVESFGGVATLLVVAGPWNGKRADEDPEFVSFLEAACRRGHEISVHGWDHARVEREAPRRVDPKRVIGGLVSRGCEEFWLLGEREARVRLRRSIDALRRMGITPVGFTPPGWLASRGTVRAAASLGLRYRTSHRGIHDLQTGAFVASFALSQRPDAASSGSCAGAVAWAGRSLLRTGSLVRLALHPNDLRDDRLIRSSETILRLASDRHIATCTYESVVDARRRAVLKESTRRPTWPIEA